jgi:opacity protein-like surface antigen
MKNALRLLAAVSAAGGLAAPASAQYQQPVPQPYPGQPGYGYQQGYSAYGQQGYAQNPVGAIIDQLLGNRYSVTDRQAVRQCATAVIAQAQSQYGGGYGNGYGNGYNRGYSNLRVSSISDVQRRQNGLRVRGTLSSGYGGGYSGQYGYQNRNYGGGELTFRCNVDYRGAVTNIRIGRNNGYRG